MTSADAMGVASAALSRIQNISTEMVEFCLKVAILVSDLVFIVAAFFATWEWACGAACRCAQPLRVYAAGCVVICCFDALLEIARCLLEGSLDQLQAQCSNVSSNAVSDQGLLGEGLAPGEARAGRTLRRTMLSLPHSNPWNYVIQEKSSKQKRMADL